MERIDISRQQGAHPRIGAIDVCPIVWPTPALRDEAREVALAVAEQLASLGLPVFLYGELASTPERAERAYFRRGGTPELNRRMLADELEPDLGPGWPHPTGGSGPGHRATPARGLQRRARGRGRRVRRARSPARCASRAAGCTGSARSRSSSASGRMQISTNVHDPTATPLAVVVERIRELAAEHGAEPVAAELVGLVPAAALDGYPDDVPIAGSDPHRRTIEAHLNDLD